VRLAAVTLVALMIAPSAAAQTSPPDARAHLQAGRYTEAAEAARSEIAASPQAAEAWRTLGDALSAMGENEEALQAYQEILPGPQGPRLDVEMAMARVERLQDPSARWRQRTRDVLAAYGDRSRVLSPAEIRAAGDAAWALAREDPALYATALRIYEEAIRRDPEDPASHVAIGDLLLDRYNNEEALEAYRAALRIDSDYAPALLGIAHSQHFDHSAGAIDAARKVVEMRPNDLGALVLLARLHLELEDFTESEAFIHRALTVNPRSPEALTLSAALAFLRGKQQEFDARVAEIREHAPGFPALFETLAEIAAQNRYYARAERFALWAVNRNPSSWRGYALLGINRLRLGEMDDGRDALEVAFRGDPFDPRTKNALELLDVLEDYEQFRSGRFVLSAHSREMRVLAPRVMEIAEQAYDYFSGQYGYHPPTPIRIEFYRRHEDFSVRTTGLVGVDILGVSFGPVVALDSPSAGVFGPVNFASTLWHELAHSFHLGLTNSRVPRWFSEGLAVFEERRARPGWGFDVTPDFLTAFQAGRLSPASALNQSFLRPSYPEQVVHAYFQGALLMEMIERDHGFEAIVDMLDAYREGRPTDEVLRQVLGLEPEALDAAFEAYVRERFGRALRALSPASGSDQSDLAEGRYPQLLREARRAMEADEHERALEALLEAQSLFPEHAGPDSTYPLLAALYLERGEMELAVDQLKRSIAIDADDLDAHRRLAELYISHGDAAAAEVIEDTLLIQPFDAALYRSLAEIRESGNEWQKAAAAREAVVALDPVDAAEARYLLARAHHRAGEFGAAKREVLGALEVAPMYEEALELLLEIREASGA
jgi:tetratricopeptide (TPR) repeat protein